LGLVISLKKIFYTNPASPVSIQWKRSKEIMKTIITSLAMAVLGIGLLIVGCSKKQTAIFQSLKNPEVAAQLKSFVAQKEAQANVVAKADGKGMPPEYKKFFAAAEQGDWLTISNMFWDMGRMNGALYGGTHQPDMTFRGSRWETAKEIWGAFDEINAGDEKYAVAFGNDIIDSIPPGSVYFGGTDPGRFIVTALQKSHVDGDPFFTLTQNALADGSYLDYLRSMFGGKIYIPTPEDSQKCFEDYTEDAKRRLKENKLKPGEDVKEMADGQMQISGQVAVMEINGLLVKTIFDQNTNREFYIEESYPFDWMYPNLEPHGLIMKINRQPLTALSDEIVKQDRDYWAKYVAPMIGDWLKPGTTIGEVTAFTEKVYVKKDLSGFAGDPQFVQNEYSCKMFSKLRSSIGGLYAWRAQHATDAAEKRRMDDAADFAFRQAWALCPYSPEAVFRYVNLLLSENRLSDAILVAETAAKFSSGFGLDAAQIQNLVGQLKQFQKEQFQRAK
jgi:hypothetical protein